MERANFATELRASVSGDGRTAQAMIPYMRQSVDLGGFREQIAPGAFTEALKPGADVLCLHDHDFKVVLGRTKSGTLRFHDASDGLHYEVQLPNSPAGHDLAESIRRGDVDATSFGFTCPAGGDVWENRSGMALRTLRNINVFEVSPCSMAAYPESTVNVRALPALIAELIERHRRNEPVDAWRRRMDLSMDIAHRRHPFSGGAYMRYQNAKRDSSSRNA